MRFMPRLFDFARVEVRRQSDPPFPDRQPKLPRFRRVDRDQDIALADAIGVLEGVGDELVGEQP